MVEVKKRDKETSESLVRRFSRQLQQSRVLNVARSRRFLQRKKSKRKLREEALYKAKIRKEVEKLKKLGKFSEEKLKDIKRKMID